MINGKFGFAVIGYGGMGSWHTRKVKNEMGEYAELIGIYDIDPARNKVAEENGIHAFASREELLADERIDLVTVATPNDYHKEIVMAALRAGKNVISEKPVTICSADLEEMIACANECGKLFTVHQNRRWDEDYLTMKKLLDDGTLGKVFRIESRVQGSRGIPGDWRNQKQHGGGMVFDWGIHLLDQALMMTLPRKLKTVYAELTNVTNENCDDGFRATLIFDDGLSFYVEVTTSNFISLPLWYMLGENGTSVIDDWDCSGKTSWSPIGKTGTPCPSLRAQVSPRQWRRGRTTPSRSILSTSKRPTGANTTRMCSHISGARNPLSLPTISSAGF